MPHAPEQADDRRAGGRAVARYDRRHRDYVVGVGGVAHPEEEPEHRDGQQARHGALAAEAELTRLPTFSTKRKSRSSRAQSGARVNGAVPKLVRKAVRRPPPHHPTALPPFALASARVALRGIPYRRPGRVRRARRPPQPRNRPRTCRCRNLGSAPRRADAPTRGGLGPDRALHRGLHRHRPLAALLLHLHRHGSPLLRRRAGGEDGHDGAGPGAHRAWRSPAGWAPASRRSSAP